MNHLTNSYGIETSSFEEVVKKLNFGHCQERQLREEAKEQGIELPEFFIAVSNVSCGGRSFVLRFGANPVKVQDESLNGEWVILTQEDFESITLSSATSMTEVNAIRGDNGWTLTIDIPVTENGEYHGFYYEKFIS
jgi:hypothetical protein